MGIVKRTNHGEDAITIVSVSLLLINLVLLGIVAFEGNIAPISLLIFMTMFASVLIISFSKEEILLKVKIFVFFFSVYLLYTLIYHYILLSNSVYDWTFTFADEPKFYHFSELALPYINGEKDFLELFSNWRLPLHDLPLHTVFSGSITYFSMMIDGSNSVLIQKLLSPFLGGFLLVFLYATIKYQFKDTKFALKATLAYGLLSAVFMYSTPMLRDIDVALAYMVFFYIFLQKFTYIRLGILFLIAFLTVYLRLESGMVLYGLMLLYIYFYIRTINNKSIKLIFYMFMVILFSLVVMLMYKKVTGKIISVDESYAAKGIARSSSSSISLLFDKLPFGLSHTAKLFFSQMKPFPFVAAIDLPLKALSGLFWPFVFIMMVYTVIKKRIREQMNDKLKFLLIISIIVLLLMSSGPVIRRMMSVYPVIYIASLYTLYVLPNNKIKGFFYFYIFCLFSLNAIYYLIKL